MLNPNLMNLKKIFTCTVLFFTLTSYYSQILNIDRSIKADTTFKRVRGSFNFNFSNDKQKRNLIDFSNVTEVDFFLKNNYSFIFLTKSELSFNGLTVLENNGFFQLRFRDNDTRIIAPDVFTQYQWNGVQGLERRALLGINARINWMEKKKSDLYTGIGCFYELEKWNPFLGSYAFAQDSLSIVNRDLFRLNLTAKFALKLSKHIDFAGTTFVQFPLNSYFASPRWFFDSNLFFNVNKHLAFTLHYDHNYDAYRPLPIDNYYYSLTTGINIKF
jgi:hypothetical protein